MIQSLVTFNTCFVYIMVKYLIPNSMKFLQGSGTSSSGGDSSCDEMRMRKPRIRTSALSEPLRESCNGVSDYTSSTGEESCDTVIYVGPDGAVSDRDLTDNEGPSHMTEVKEGSKGVKVNTTLKAKLDALERVPEENRGYGRESMELEYDLSEEFKGDIEKVPERGSVENLTIAKKKKKKLGDNAQCEFWEDALCTKDNEVSTTNTCESLPKEPEDQPMVAVEDTTKSHADHFAPIKETTSECDLTSGDNTNNDELSHSPALDTPLSTFYHLVPDPSLAETDIQEKSSNRDTRDPCQIPPSAPPSPTSKEVRSILENYVVDQMLIKTAGNLQQVAHTGVLHHNTSEGLVPPLTPQKTCVSGTAQISATSPKRKIPAKLRGKDLTEGDRKCFSDAGDNHSDTHSEDSYGSTKTDPLHYVKPPRRGLKPSSVSPSSLPREYKVIIRDKTSRVRYLGYEIDSDVRTRSQNSPDKGSPVQLKYCGYELNNECDNLSPKSPALSEDGRRAPLTITSRASFAFNFGTPPSKKAAIENENIKSDEPYGSHFEASSTKCNEKAISRKGEMTPVNSESDSPKKSSCKLGVPRQRSKLKISR